jgi:hypothetical protein
MHSDSVCSQQVDIENYNVSASRLLTPARKEEIMRKNNIKGRWLMVASKKLPELRKKSINCEDKTFGLVCAFVAVRKAVRSIGQRHSSVGS